MSPAPRLSICVVTYNHEKFIAGTLDSFLRQKTNFPFQIIVGDDASTDSTPQILRAYAEKYPDIVKPILREKNISPIKNSLDVYAHAKTEFVALCDGDDSWSDENKLQTQVDYLDAHPETAISYHLTCIHHEDFSRDDYLYPPPAKRFNKDVMTLDDLAVGNPMHTSSVVYRWRFKDADIRAFMPDNISPGDYFLSLLHAEVGNIAFIDRVMSVYRVHSGGMSFGLRKQRYDLVWLKYGLEELNFHRAVDRHFDSRLYKYFHNAIERKAVAVLTSYIRHGAFDKLAEYRREHPNYYELAVDSLNHIDRTRPWLSDGSVARAAPQARDKARFGAGDYWRMLTAHGPRLPLYYFFNAHLFDLLHGTDTHQPKYKDQYYALQNNLENGEHYKASWTNEIERTFYALRAIVTDFSSHAFIDVGCGKGKVVLVWEQLLRQENLEQEVFGIDFYRPLLSIAEVNHRRLFDTVGTFIHADAAAFNFSAYGPKLIVYLYNPFDEVILRAMLGRLRDTQAYIVYNNPVHEQVVLDAGYREVYRHKGFHPNMQTVIFKRAPETI